MLSSILSFEIPSYLLRLSLKARSSSNAVRSPCWPIVISPLNLRSSSSVLQKWAFFNDMLHKFDRIWNFTAVLCFVKVKILYYFDVRTWTKVESWVLFLASWLFNLLARLNLLIDYLSRSTECIKKRLGMSTFLILLLWRWPIKCQRISLGSYSVWCLYFLTLLGQLLDVVLTEIPATLVVNDFDLFWSAGFANYDHLWSWSLEFLGQWTDLIQQELVLVMRHLLTISNLFLVVSRPKNRGTHSDIGWTLFNLHQETSTDLRKSADIPMLSSI